MLLVVCSSYVPLRVRLKLGSRLTYTSLHKASVLFLWVSPMYVKLRGEPRTCTDSNRDLGIFSLDLFSLVLLYSFCLAEGPFLVTLARKWGLSKSFSHPSCHCSADLWLAPNLGAKIEEQRDQKELYPFFGRNGPFISVLVVHIGAAL